jgi:hypothetical protein
VSCARCATPLEDGDLRCAVCALPAPIVDVPIASPQILRCTECSAAIQFDAKRGTPACAFCGAVMTVEQPVDPVEVVARALPFTVERAAATAALRGWLGERGFFAPKTLRDEAVIDSMHPLCWAAWIVDAHAQVSWTADSDAGSGRSAWAPHAGVETIELDGLVVSASRGLAARECAALAPFYDLETAAADTGDVPVESFDVQRSAARRAVLGAIEAVARTRIQRVIPGHRYRNVHVSCLLQRQTTDRIALPAWVLAYRYRGSPYRAIVHGQRADIVVGSSPTDWRKVLWIVLAAAFVVAAIAAIAMSR